MTTNEQFWITRDTSGRGTKIEIRKSKLLDFCSERLGYYNYIDYNGGYNLIRVTNNCIFKDARIEGMKQDLKWYIREEIQNELLWDEIFTSNLLDKNFTDMLTVKGDTNFNVSTKDEAHLYYLNGAVIVTKAGFRIIPYAEYEGHVWASQINQRNFVPKPTGELSASDFRRFLFNISGKNQQRFRSLVSTIGYLLHPYKNPTLTKAVILIDEKIDFSGQANGGTGKSLLVKGISNITPMAWKDGKRFNGRETFAFDSIRPHHRILYLDDINPGLDFSDFYPFITGDLQIQRKYKDSAIIPFEQVPKLVMTTNYVVRGAGGETDERRRVEFEVAPHYSIAYKPTDEFGRMFFDEWDTDEWSLFDNVMLNCVQFYLTFGLISYQSDSLSKNKLIAATSFDFVEFAKDHIILNEKLNKTVLLGRLKELYPDQKHLSHTMFKRWIDIWANDKKYITKHYKSNGNAIVILSVKESNI